MASLKESWEWLVNTFMPIEGVEAEEEEIREPKKQQKQSEAETRRVVGGGYVDYGTGTVSGASGYTPEENPYIGRVTEQRSSARPTFTVHETKQSDMRVRVYVPEKFDHAEEIAKLLKEGQTIVVNFSSIDEQGHRRIFDFLMGVTYVLRGEMRKVTNDIMVYAPPGVELYPKTDGLVK